MKQKIRKDKDNSPYNLGEQTPSGLGATKSVRGATPRTAVSGKNYADTNIQKTKEEMSNNYHRERHGLPVELVEEIIKERGSKCQLCCCELNNGEKLSRRQFHHIIPFRHSKRDRKDELLLLCLHCHKNLEGKMKQYEKHSLKQAELKGYQQGKEDERKRILEIIEELRDVSLERSTGGDVWINSESLKDGILKQQINNPDERVRLALSHNNAREEENGK